MKEYDEMDEDELSDALLKAAGDGKSAEVEELLNRSADIEAEDDEGRTPLVLAAENGHADCVSLLLDRGADVDAEDDEGKTALRHAFESGCMEIVEALLDYGAEISDEIFSAVIESDNSDILSMLIRKAEDSGSRPDAEELLSEAVECDAFHSAGVILDRYDTSASRLASMELRFTRNLSMAELLLGYGAGLHGSDDIKDPLLDAVKEGEQAYAELLIRYYEELFREKPFSADDERKISAAIKKRDAKTVRYFLGGHESMDEVVSRERTDLIYAAAQGDAETALGLIDDGADVDAEDEDGRTALSHAAESGLVEVVKALLDHGADVDAEDDEGRTALSYAAESGFVGITEVLLDRGADVNVEDAGWTALNYAVESGCVEIAEALLDHGADVNAVDSFFYEPLILAAQSGHTGMVSLLLDRGADIDCRDDDGQTALMSAVQSGRMDTALLLVERGADVGAKDDEGHTAMRFAVEAFLNRRLAADCVRKLISAGFPVSKDDAEALISGLKAGKAAVQRSGKNTLYKALLAAASRLDDGIAEASPQENACAL